MPPRRCSAVRFWPTPPHWGHEITSPSSPLHTLRVEQMDLEACILFWFSLHTGKPVRTPWLSVSCVLTPVVLPQQGCTLLALLLLPNRPGHEPTATRIPTLIADRPIVLWNMHPGPGTHTPRSSQDRPHTSLRYGTLYWKTCSILGSQPLRPHWIYLSATTTACSFLI